MTVTPITSKRHGTEDERLQRAMAGDQEALTALLRQLGSNNPWLQQIVLETIYDSDDPEVWRQLLVGLALKRWPGIDVYQGHLAPEAAQRLEAAILRLFSVDESEAGSTPVKLLVAQAALSDPECRQRSTAAVIFALRGDARGFDELRRAALEGEPDCRQRAISALGKLADERAAWVLTEVLADPDEAPRLQAVQALDELRDLALPALLTAAKHSEAHVRWHAIRALGTIAAPASAPTLAQALADQDYRVRWTAADALVNLGAEAVPAILTCLAQSMPVDDSLQAARYALHRIGPHHMQAWLEPLLHALSGPAAPVEAPALAYRLLQEWETRLGG